MFTKKACTKFNWWVRNNLSTKYSIWILHVNCDKRDKKIENGHIWEELIGVRKNRRHCHMVIISCKQYIECTVFSCKQYIPNFVNSTMLTWECTVGWSSAVNNILNFVSSAAVNCTFPTFNIIALYHQLWIVHSQSYAICFLRNIVSW